MSIPDELMNRLEADLRHRQEQRRRSMDRLAAASATVTSPMNQLTVTVGTRGAIQDLRFNNRDYRDMSAEDLSTLVLDTINQASRRWRDQAAAALRDSAVPAVAGLLDGTGDLSDLLPTSLLDEAIAPKPNWSAR